MALNVIRKFQNHSSLLSHCLRQLVLARVPSLAHQRGTSIYEPDYLESMKPKVPIYDALNVQLRGYDYPILENFQRYVHKIAENMNIEVEDGWALPAQKLKIQRYKPASTVTETEYDMTIYERNIQVVNLPSTTGTIFFEVLQTALPEGVTMTVQEHDEELEEIKYVPDAELIQLKTELEEMGGPRKKK